MELCMATALIGPYTLAPHCASFTPETYLLNDDEEFAKSTFSAGLMILLALLAALAASVSATLHTHDLALTWEHGEPNGQSREMIKMNGQFPGPTFHWDEDDDVEIWVHNQMPFNVSVHWHGLEQRGTPWSDGAVGVTQKPIEVGQSFIYRFKAYPAGTHWYHSHSRMTLMDGLYGAIVIRRKQDTARPWHLISADEKDIEDMERAANAPNVLTVSDWTQFVSWEYLAAEEASSLSLFCFDSLLLNGKGKVDCPGEDFLVNHTSTYMKYALYPSHVNDKGCFPFIKPTQGQYLWSSHPERVPIHMQRGCIPSEGAREVLNVARSEGWASISFIMAGTVKTVVASIDHHEMWVYEVDGGLIEPQRVDAFHMYAGERLSVLIRLDQPIRDYTIRVPEAGLTQIVNAMATLRYQGSKDHSETYGMIDYGGRNTTPGLVYLDRNHLPPYPPNPPAHVADQFEVLRTHRWYAPWKYTMSKGPVNTGGLWSEDRGAYTPLLYDVEQELAKNESLIITTKNGTWVDLVVQVGSHPSQPQEFPHVMHKHAQKMWKIGGGLGVWNYSSTQEAITLQPELFNLDNPPYRDTFTTWFDGPMWMVLRYQVTNPGPWLFHCHIELHMSGGMSTAILDGIDAWPTVPSEYAADSKGFRHADGSPHGYAWEKQNVLSAEQSCAHPQEVNPGLWHIMLEKAIVFLKQLQHEDPQTTLTD